MQQFPVCHFLNIDGLFWWQVSLHHFLDNPDPEPPDILWRFHIYFFPKKAIPFLFRHLLACRFVGGIPAFSQASWKLLTVFANS